jgi:hypothetical protein
MILKKDSCFNDLDHKKEFMSLFLNIALVSSQIVQLTLKTSFFSEKYVIMSS